jgi:hypothetical protein
MCGKAEPILTTGGEAVLPMPHDFEAKTRISYE